ncbi:MAG: MFS transporter [Bacteroidetes bacterium]|nr:MAG: MFS transporter [Bacteroidota bacterium]
MKSLLKKYFSGLTKDTFFLALASFFSDISTEMLYPILPVYLSQNLNASGSIIGIIEGFAQAAQNIIQSFSGWLSDKLQKRKPVALFGFILSAISKPFMGVFTTWGGVMAARISDRLGAGTRSAPRDALVAGSVDEKNKGKAFGLEGIGDNLGAFVGPLLTILLFFTLQIAIRHIFYLAIIPGLLAVTMIFFVKEKRTDVKAKTSIDVHVRNFPKAYWKYLMIIALFGIGNSSNSFLILEIKDTGLSLVDTILVYAFFNLVAAIISYPAGSLSDKFGRKPILFIAFVIFLITYVGFAFSTNILVMGLLFVFYGLFQGIFRSVGKSFAADFVPAHLRASSIGWYSTIVGLSGLIASITGGILWDRVSHSAVFIYGAIVSFLACIVLLIFLPAKK